MFIAFKTPKPEIVVVVCWVKNKLIRGTVSKDIWKSFLGLIVYFTFSLNCLEIIFYEHSCFYFVERNINGMLVI